MNLVAKEYIAAQDPQDPRRAGAEQIRRRRPPARQRPAGQSARCRRIGRGDGPRFDPCRSPTARSAGKPHGAPSRAPRPALWGRNFLARRSRSPRRTLAEGQSPDSRRTGAGGAGADHRDTTAGPGEHGADGGWAIGVGNGGDPVADAGLRRRRKRFFFEKEEPKNFCGLGAPAGATLPSDSESFLRLFSKKTSLPSPRPNTCWRTQARPSALGLIDQPVRQPPSDPAA